MRIALLSHAPVHGGSTDLFIQTRDFFLSRGHDVQCIFGQGTEKPDPRTKGAWVLPATPGGWRRHLQTYVDLIRGFNPELVYAISGRDEADLMRFLPFVRVRHLSSLEEHEYFNVPHTLKKTRRFLEACTANTPDTLAQVERISGKPTFLLPYLFPEPLHSITEIDATRLADPKAPIELAFVSRIERFQKRCHWLPEIIRRCEQGGAHLRWHFYGDGPLLSELQQRVASNPNVVVHGWISRQELYEKLPHHDIFFLCSRWEGLPIAMVEAMRCGLACVCPDIPAGIRWTLEQGGGWLYDARSAGYAATALMNAVKDRSVLLEKRRESLRLAGELFSSRRAERQFLELETSLQSLRFNGDFLRVDQAPKFRAVSVPTYLRRVILRPKR